MLFDFIHISKIRKQYMAKDAKSLPYKATIRPAREARYTYSPTHFKEQLITVPFRVFKHFHRKG